MDYTASAECPEGVLPGLYDMYRVVFYERPCPMPEDVAHASQYACLEGTHISHRKECTPSCQPGFKANIPALKCFDGSLKPKLFVCLEISEDEKANPLAP